MKTLWKNLPAWLKGIFLNLILLFPILLINQSIIGINASFLPQYGWGLVAIMVSLTIYWKLVNRLNPFKKEEDNKLELRFNILSGANWMKISGLVFFSFAIINLFLMITPEGGSAQIQFIQGFKAFPPITAIPLLLGLALSAGVVEEVTYRGFIQNTLNRKYSRVLTYTLVGALFAVMHVLPLELVLPYVLVSIAYSIVVDQQRSLGLVIFTHSLFDFILFVNIYFDVFDHASPTAINIAISVLLLASGTFLIFFKKNWKFRERENQELQLS